MNYDDTLYKFNKSDITIENRYIKENNFYVSLKINGNAIIVIIDVEFSSIECYKCDLCDCFNFDYDEEIEETLRYFLCNLLLKNGLLWN